MLDTLFPKFLEGNISSLLPEPWVLHGRYRASLSVSSVWVSVRLVTGLEFRLVSDTLLIWVVYKQVGPKVFTSFCLFHALWLISHCANETLASFSVTDNPNRGAHLVLKAAPACASVHITHPWLSPEPPPCLILCPLLGLQAAGWKTGKHHLEVGEWRATWPVSPEKKVI